MGGFLIVVMKLYIIKYDDVRNLQIFEYLYDDLRHSRKQVNTIALIKYII